MSAPNPDSSTDLPAHRLRRSQEPPRGVIIGGGPLGLEAALYAKRLGHAVWLLEREAQIAPDVRAWSHVTMFTPWEANRSSLGAMALSDRGQGLSSKPAPLAPAGVHPTGGEFLRQYLEPLAKLLPDSLLTDTRAVALGKSYLFPEEHADDPEKRAARRFRVLTRSSVEERVFTADYVVDATGITHAPHWLGPGGMPAQGEMGSSRHIHYQVPDILGHDRIHFLGKRTLLIGDGASAATSAVALADVIDREPPGSLLWVTKSRTEMPLTLIENDPLTRRDTLFKKASLLIKTKHPQIEYSPITQVEAVQHSLATGRFQITLQVNHQTQRLSVDSVIANVGYRRDVQTYERALHPDEPGLYVIGEKATVSGDFFLKDGHRQIRDAFRLICHQPDLDLYAEAQDSLKRV